MHLLPYVQFEVSCECDGAVFIFTLFVPLRVVLKLETETFLGRLGVFGVTPKVSAQMGLRPAT